MAKISDDAYNIGPKNSENYKIIYASDKKTKLGVWKKIRDQIYIGFKGTEVNYHDLSTDANIKQGKFTFGPNKKPYNIHNGFMKAYKSANLSEIKKILNNEKISSIWITGHSLGGALATLCAMDLSINFKLVSDKILLYSFASPMIGDKNFQTQCNKLVKNNLRCFMGGDLIPNLPPSIPNNNYFSVGIPKKLKYPYSSSPSAIVSKGANILPIFGLFGALASVVLKSPDVYYHHSLDSYKKAIRKLGT